MKVELDNIVLGNGGWSGKVYAGLLNKKGDMWLKKVDISQSFINTVIQKWENKTEVFDDGKAKWKITVKKLK